MKKLLASAMLAFCFLSAPVSAACAPDKTYDYLLKEVQGIKGIKIYKLNDDGLKLWLSYTNRLRKSMDPPRFTYEGDTLVYGKFLMNNRYHVGEALFADGCLLPGTNQVMLVDDFMAFMTRAGINPFMSTKIFP
jgi:hypothetical protein